MHGPRIVVNDCYRIVDRVVAGPIQILSGGQRIDRAHATEIGGEGLDPGGQVGAFGDLGCLLGEGRRLRDLGRGPRRRGRQRRNGAQRSQ